MANKPQRKVRTYGKNISKYRDILGITTHELADFLGYGYTTIIQDEKSDNRSLGIGKIYDYIDAFKDISREKSNGKQILRLEPNDLVYEIFE